MAAGYRDLVAWNKAMLLAEQLYRATASFPRHEQYGLTSQIRRAGVSVVSCIAEGHSRRSRKEFAHFLSIALGSLAEVETQVLLAGRLGYLANQADTILPLSSEISRMLHGLRNSCA